MPRILSHRVLITFAVAAAVAVLSNAMAQDDVRLPGRLPAIRHPVDNPTSPAKVALGKELFHDVRLSRNDRVACATCHDPEKAFTIGDRFAKGVDGKPGTRSVPTLINVGYGAAFFWDGRAVSLEEQALAPIENPQEMDMPLDALTKKLNEIPAYRDQFQNVFGGEPTPKRIGQALAAFQRTLVSSDTPFDKYLAGDQAVLGPAATRGMSLFFGKARCFVCHQGPNLSDDKFHNIAPAGPKDLGRRDVTKQAKDHGAFKTPQLREVGRTAPYMHDGRFKTLDEVVQHYNFGGVTDEANDHRDELLQVLYLSEREAADLVAFLSQGLTTP